MENLPQIAINKIMFFLSHPTADIMKGSIMFDFMAIRFNKYRTLTSNINCRGSPWNCGYIDAVMRHRYFRPRKFTINANGERSTKMTLTDEEHDEYIVSYRHASKPQDVIGPRDLFPRWRIRGNPFIFHPNEHENLEPESGTQTDSDSEVEPDSDSDSDSGWIFRPNAAT
jgi:hypothetical protein